MEIQEEEAEVEVKEDEERPKQKFIKYDIPTYLQKFSSTYFKKAIKDKLSPKKIKKPIKERFRFIICYIYVISLQNHTL